MINRFERTFAAVWRPQGDQFAYFSVPTRPPGESLWIGDLRGQSKELLTAKEGQFFRWHPIWSPDGDRLAVCSVTVSESASGEDVKFEVLVVDKNTGEITAKCEFPEGVIEPELLSPPSAFKWSPHGRYILLSWESSAVVNLERNRSIRISEGYSVAEWQPTGESVLYFDFQPRESRIEDWPHGQIKGLFRLDLGDGSRHLVADKKALTEFNVMEIPGMFRAKMVLSPSGKYLVLVVGAVQNNAKVTEMRVFPLDSQGGMRLASPSRVWTLESELPISVQWSPDDSHLAAILMKNWRQLTLATFRLSSGERHKVADLDFDVRQGTSALDFIGSQKILSWSD